MKAKFEYVLFLFCIMTIYSCGDQEYTTTTTGVVLDNSTGKPLSDAYLVMIHRVDKDGMTFLYNSNTYSDDNGEYLLSLTSNGDAIASMKVRKQGYTDELRYLDLGSATVQNYTLAPYDAWVRFKLANKLGKDNSIYAPYWNDFFGSSTLSSIKVDPAQIKVFIDKVPGGIPIFIAWDYSYFYTSYKHPFPYPHLDTIIVPRGDTLDYLITF